MCSETFDYFNDLLFFRRPKKIKNTELIAQSRLESVSEYDHYFNRFFLVKLSTFYQREKKTKKVKKNRKSIGSITFLTPYPPSVFINQFF